ncbi:hypothetical protein DL1_02955 [Thioclava dalianensis]|uniref:DUF1579 domain-containing protein n=1 Tax=Thioclava dalianensis TaxID=1185766 RepID=A0A074U4R7_9RHOB|nr:hypothetical protein [Thioclava dalianensis]KEP69642.1 hypothetical protein DL1_02955 [Thioclava dalianensis]SFN14839.1 hypothetical protein SAMN05216224_102655 [Thioclava dalianensis]
MTRALLILLLGLSPALACAQDTSVPAKPGDLVAALSGDWNGDGVADAVTLQQDDDYSADLTVYLGDPVYGLKPAVSVKSAMFSGQGGGQTPTIKALSKSAFALHQEQIGFGRTPWEATFSVAWRDGHFVVSGYSYQYYDRIDPDHQGSCDVNLLAGNYEITLDGQTKTGQQDMRAFPLSKLNPDFMPTICQSIFDR